MYVFSFEFDGFQFLLVDFGKNGDGKTK